MCVWAVGGWVACLCLIYRQRYHFHPVSTPLISRLLHHFTFVSRINPRLGLSLLPNVPSSLHLSVFYTHALFFPPAGLSFSKVFCLPPLCPDWEEQSMCKADEKESARTSKEGRLERTEALTSQFQVND